MTFPVAFRAAARSLGGAGARLETEGLQLLRQCRQLLDELEVPAVLHRVLGEEHARWAQEELSGHLHFGFVAPSDLPPAAWGELARVAGFLGQLQSFRSEILARELSWRLGGRPVPVTVLKMETVLATGGTGGVEAFLPEVDRDTGRRWVAEGLGAHLGLGLKRSESLDRVQQICGERGFSLPPFMNGHPATNASHGVRVLYLDDRLESGPFRWEFYHSSAEVERGQASTRS